MGFNAGAIEGTLTLDTAPFAAGLEWARKEAKRFQQEKFQAKATLDDADVKKKTDQARDALGRFAKTKADAKVDIDDTKFKLNYGIITSALRYLGKMKLTPSVHLDIAPALASAAILKKVLDNFGLDSAVKSGAAAMLKPGGLVAGLLALTAAAIPAAQALGGVGLAAVVGLGAAMASTMLFTKVMTSQYKTLEKAAEEGISLTGPAGRAQKHLAHLKATYKDFQKAVSGPTFGLMSEAFKVAHTLLPRLVPLVRTMANGLTNVVARLEGLFRSKTFSVFLKDLRQFMDGFLKRFGPALVNLLGAFMSGFHALKPLFKVIGSGIDVMLRSLRSFASGPGMKDFVKLAVEALPKVVKLIGSALNLVGSILKGLGPLSGPALKFITGLLNAVAKLNIAPLAKALGDFLNALAPIIPIGISLINTLLKPLAWIISDLSKGPLKTLIKSIGTELAPVFKTLGRTLMTLAPFISEFIGSIAILVTPTGMRLLRVLIESLSKVLIKLAPHLTALGVAFNTVIGTVIEKLTPYLPGLISLFGNFALMLLKHFVPVVVRLVKAFGPFIEKLLPILIPMLAQLATKFFPWLLSVIKDIIPIVVGFAKSLAPIVGPLLGTLIKVLPPIIATIVKLAVNIFRQLVPAFVDLMRKMAPIVKLMLERLGPYLKMVAHIITTYLVPAVVKIIGWIGDFIVAWVKLYLKIENVVNTKIKPTFAKFIDMIKDLKTKFSEGVDAIGLAWERIQSLAKIPIKFVIEKVLNEGLIGGFNKIAEFLSGGSTKNNIPPIGLPPGFYRGGPTGGGDDRKVAGVAHANEHYASADEVRKTPGGHNTWARMRSLIRQGDTDWLPGYFMGGGVAPVPGNAKRHRGYPWARWSGDLSASHGDPVRAYKDGVVSAVKHLTTSYGKHVRINHTGEETLYAHLSKILVNAGQRVTGGQTIGNVGNTGNSFGAHLHFELKGGTGKLDMSNQGGAGDKGRGTVFDVVGKVGSMLKKLKDKVTSGVGDGLLGKIMTAIPQKLGGLIKSPLQILADKVAAASAAAGATSGATGNQFSTAAQGGEQNRNAAIIANVGAPMGRRAQIIGIATAIVESGLRNLGYGDRDSVGLFQQRTPWGPRSARMDPTQSAGMFFHGGRGGQRGLDDIKGWQTMGMGRAAQAVQVSAFPGRYDQVMGRATNILQGLKVTRPGLPAGSSSGASAKGRFMTNVGRGIAGSEKLARSMGISQIGTYPGHHPSMAKARDYMVRGAKGDRFAEALWAGRKQFGLWYQIWNRRIRSMTRQAAGWIRYNRSNPHTDHVHGGFYADGIAKAPGGWGWVGENGAELVKMPAGTNILNRSRSLHMARGGQPAGVAPTGPSNDYAVLQMLQKIAKHLADQPTRDDQAALLDALGRLGASNAKALLQSVRAA